MKEKNYFQLDELGNRLYTRVMSSPEGVNLTANIHMKRVGASEVEFIANYFFLEQELIFKNKRKKWLQDSYYVAFHDCIFAHLPFEVSVIKFELDADFFEISKDIFDHNKVYPDGKDLSFKCNGYIPFNLLKKSEHFNFLF